MTAALIVLATANVAMAAVLVFAYRAQTRQMESLVRAVVSKHAGEYAGIERSIARPSKLAPVEEFADTPKADLRDRLAVSLDEQPQPGVPVGFDGT